MRVFCKRRKLFFVFVGGLWVIVWPQSMINFSMDDVWFVVSKLFYSKITANPTVISWYPVVFSNFDAYNYHFIWNVEWKVQQSVKLGDVCGYLGARRRRMSRRSLLKLKFSPTFLYLHIIYSKCSKIRLFKLIILRSIFRSNLAQLLTYLLSYTILYTLTL